MAVDGNNQVFVRSGTGAPGVGTIWEYNATTGAAISVPFITASQGISGPAGLALDANNHLLVVNNGANTVGQYDATTGATINPTLIIDNQGLNVPTAVALDKVTHHLFVYDAVVDNIAEFDATSGVTVKYH